MSRVGQSSAWLFDPGLQPERTELAWRRTILTLVVGALVALRILPAALGWWGLAAGFVGLLTSGALWALASRRSRRERAVLLGSAADLPDGRLLLMTAALATGGAAVAAIYALVT